MTFDLDLVVQLHPQNTARAMEALQSLGYKPTVPVAASLFANAQIRQSWITEKGVVVFQLHSNLHPDTTIDLFVTEPFDFDAEYYRALIGELLPGRETRFVGMAALIRMKEAAGRAKDLEDIRQLKLLQENS
jgi:hypothetical protein